MARRGPRWLVVDAERFAWSVGHRPEDGGETLRLRREGSRGQLLVVFSSGGGHLAADGHPMHAGLIQHADGRQLNLNQPGVARAVLDEALALGWQPGAPGPARLDGWSLFDAVAQRRAEAASPGDDGA